MTTAIADERSAEFEDKDTDNEDILFGNSVVYPTEKARNLPDEFYMKTVTFEYHPIMAFDKTTEEMAVPMEINVKSALNDIFEGENVLLEGEEKPVKKEEDPEQDEGVEHSIFQLAENVEQSPIDNPVAQEQSPTENEPKFTPEMGHEKSLRKESAYVKQTEGRELLSLPPVYFLWESRPFLPQMGKPKWVAVTWRQRWML